MHRKLGFHPLVNFLMAAWQSYRMLLHCDFHVIAACSPGETASIRSLLGSNRRLRIEANKLHAIKKIKAC